MAELHDKAPGAEIIRYTPGADVGKIREGIEENFKSSVESGLIITGTPKTVLKRIRFMLESLRPGIFGIWYHHGPMTFEDRKTCLRLLGQEVLPAMLGGEVERVPATEPRRDFREPLLPPRRGALSASRLPR